MINEKSVEYCVKFYAFYVFHNHKVIETKTGLECYEAERISDKSVLTIYGIRFIKLEFLYYLIPRFEEKENIITYPILITNLTDSMF